MTTATSILGAFGGLALVIAFLWWKDKYARSLVRQRDDAQTNLRETVLELAKVEASRDGLAATAARQAQTLRQQKERRDAEIGVTWDLVAKHGDDMLRRKLEALLGKARDPGGTGG